LDGGLNRSTQHFNLTQFSAADQAAARLMLLMLYSMLLLDEEQVDGWQTLATKPIGQPIDLAA